jgi:hypothetical protein
VTERRVAVIAVHGVADQEPGETARAVARLLSEADQAGRGAATFHETPIVIGVSEATAEEEPEPPSPLRSAFLNRRLASEGKAEAPPAEPVPYDVSYAESFLRGQRLPEAERAYSTLRLSATRDPGTAHACRVDVYEMYWADLSRLGANVLRILAELYQLLFHLSTLARQTVDHARAQARGKGAKARLWRALGELHGYSEWLLSRPIALGNLLLFLIALSILPLALPERAQQIANAVILIALWGVAVAFIHRRFRWPAALFASGFLLVCAFTFHEASDALVRREPAAVLWWFSVLLAFMLFAAILRLMGERMEDIQFFGGALLAAIGVGVLWAWMVRHAAEPDLATRAVFTVITAIELGLLVLITSWILITLVHGVAYCAGWFLRDAAGRRAVFTARLGALFATALFAAVTLSLWSALNALAQPGLQRHFAEADASIYRPLHFVCRNDACAGAPGEAKPADYLKQKLADSAETLAWIALLLLVLLVVSLYALGPSLVAEASPPSATDPPEVSGAWLDDGLGLLKTAMAVSFAVFAAISFVYAGVGAWCLVWQDACPKSDSSDSLVTLIGQLLAGSAAGLVAVGNRFGKLTTSIRGVLDLILDVDNYFKDRPSRTTPRGRMYARYLALLREIARVRDGRPYDSLVIVSHSQGTVISADLLRLLANRPQYLACRLPPISLLTMGSPLRQLYASRFPHLYRWVGAAGPAQDMSGPDPAGLGVTRWVNLYQSGDYIGRVVWTSLAPGYDPWNQSPALENPAPVTVRQRCVGAGAHTHYFDGSAPGVRGELDALLR